MNVDFNLRNVHHGEHYRLSHPYLVQLRVVAERSQMIFSDVYYDYEYGLIDLIACKDADAMIWNATQEFSGQPLILKKAQAIWEFVYDMEKNVWIADTYYKKQLVVDSQ
jgi:hypothetical protein